MNKNVLIALILLCSGQSHGSNQFAGRFTPGDLLRDCGTHYSRILPTDKNKTRIIVANENPKTDGFNQLSEKTDPKLSSAGEMLRYAGHTVKYVPMAILGVLGGVVLAEEVAPALVSTYIWCSWGAFEGTVVGSGGVGFLTGLIQGPADYEKGKKIRLLKMAEEKKRDMQNLTGPSNTLQNSAEQPSIGKEGLQNVEFATVQDPISHRAYILSQKPDDSELDDEAFISEYCRALILVCQNDEDEEDNQSNAATSSSTSSSKKRFLTEFY